MANRWLAAGICVVLTGAACSSDPQNAITDDSSSSTVTTVADTTTTTERSATSTTVSGASTTTPSTTSSGTSTSTTSTSFTTSTTAAGPTTTAGSGPSTTAGNPFPGLPTATFTLTADGIGAAKLGMTVAEMRTALGDEFAVVGQDEIRVDISGYDIEWRGDLLFSANVEVGAATINAFLSDDPEVGLANGIAPGTLLSDVTDRFGSGTLSFSYSNEQREFFTFDNNASANLPDNVSIEVRAADGSFAGIYATDDEFNETTQFKADAKVFVLWVTCTPPGGFHPCPS